MAPPPNTNFPPPFNNQHIPPPFARKKNEQLHSQSPPKHYSSSPPKAFAGNKAFHGGMMDPAWAVPGRQGFHMDRMPAPPQMGGARGMPDRLNMFPNARNMPGDRHMMGPVARNAHPSWPFQPKDQLSHMKPNQPVDHRYARTKHDTQYNPNNDRW